MQRQTHLSKEEISRHQAKMMVNDNFGRLFSHVEQLIMRIGGPTSYNFIQFSPTAKEPRVLMMNIEADLQTLSNHDIISHYKYGTPISIPNGHNLVKHALKSWRSFLNGSNCDKNNRVAFHIIEEVIRQIEGGKMSPLDLGCSQHIMPEYERESLCNRVVTENQDKMVGFHHQINQSYEARLKESAKISREQKEVEFSEKPIIKYSSNYY